MFKLFDTVSNVKMQIQKKRRENSFGGMWGSALNPWGQPNNDGWGQQNNGWENQGNQGNNGWGQQNQNNGWGQQNPNNGWGQQNIGETGFAMALISNQNLWGNNFEGAAWLKQQLKRQEFNIISGEQGSLRMSDLKNILEEQITFLEPSPAEKKLAQIRREGKQFYDERFPPNDLSLHGKNRVPEWRDIKWKKISEIMPNSQIFQGKIEPDDIKQGYLGDCYFLAALAALSQRPDRIFSLFLTKQKNPQNYYSVKLLYKGKWMTIDMDEYIPVLHNQPAFTKAKDNQLWVILLQKAWAKLYKSYKQIQAGFAEQGLHDLTGAPIKKLHFKSSAFDRERQWNYLLMASQKQYSMVASSQPGSDTDTSVSGIVQGHAYTFLNATVLTYQGGQDRVVQLRNPWGKGESKGKWSDNDPNWQRVSPQEKNRVGFSINREDGKFFMTYENFLREFIALSVAEINDNASYVYKSLKDKQKSGVYFKLQIIQQGFYSLQVDKTPERDFDQFLQNQYRYPNAKLTLSRLINQNSCQKIQTYSSPLRTLYRGFKLTPGVYIAEVKVDFNDRWQKDYDVNLAVYAEYVCDIEIASKQEVIAFTGNPHVRWEPSQHIDSGAWNNMGNSGYRPGDSGWGNGGGSNQNDGWGNNNGGGKKDDGWGDYFKKKQPQDNGWGNNNNNNGNNGWGNNNNGWGNNNNNNGNNGGKKDDGWGDYFEKKQPNNQGGWGNNNNGGGGKKDDGWGDYFEKKEPHNQGWANQNSGNNGWGNNPNSGWGNPPNNQGNNNGWGNPPPQNNPNSGWGNPPQNNPNNGWGNNQGSNQGPNSSWGPGW